MSAPDGIEHARLLLGKPGEDEAVVRALQGSDVADAIVGFHAQPAELADVRRLTPWAAEFRYGETIDDSLDRASTLNLVEAVRAWAAGVIDGLGRQQ